MKKKGCIKIKSVELVNEKGEKFDIMNENLTDAVNVSIYHDYIHTPVRMEAETIKQAIKKGNYINNLCWVNALNDFYGDTLMSEKTRKRLTKERIIEIIGKSDFIEKGASITDMEKSLKNTIYKSEYSTFVISWFISMTQKRETTILKPFMLWLRTVISMF